MGAMQVDLSWLNNILQRTLPAVLVTIMAHGCNIGPYTMSHMAPGVSYSRIKHITEWILTGESQRSALASIVNALSRLLACIIYWQATEINRVINKYKPEESGIDLT